MKFYLCAPTSMAREMEFHRFSIYRSGHVVTSRWHTGKLGNPRLELNDPMILQRAIDDIRDLENSDVLIAFTGPAGRGGRHYETGYAAGNGIDVWLIGQMEHAFHSLHYHPGKQFDSWQECLDHITILTVRK